MTIATSRSGKSTLGISAFLLALNVLAPAGVFSQEPDFPLLTGPYLGQTLPGTTPELFAPGIVSVEADVEHSAAVFSPDGRELFWCARKNRYSDLPGDEVQQLYHMKMMDGRWTPPQIAGFSRGFEGVIQRPVFSPDGSRLYFDVWDSSEDDIDIYVVERELDGWSDPVPIPTVNSPAIERLHFVGADGSMYFTRNLLTRNEQVLVSRLENGQFTEPEALGSDFNSDAAEYAILMPPDETFMLTCQDTPTGSASDLHVSYKGRDGTWSERINAGFHCGGFLALSPDGKYLFFLDDQIVWVDTALIEELRPSHLRPPSQPGPSAPSIWRGADCGNPSGQSRRKASATKSRIRLELTR